MALNYKFNIKDGVFKYDCITHSSYIYIRTKDIKKIYNILKALDSILELAKRTNTKNIVYGGFTILLDNYKNKIPQKGKVVIE